MKNIIKKYQDTSLLIRIVIGIGIGFVLGLLVPKFEAISMLGMIFVDSLKAIAPSLVFLLIVTSLCTQKKEEKKSTITSIIALFMTTTLIAALVAVVASYLFPVALDLPVGNKVSEASSLGSVFKGLLTNIFSNPIDALSKGNYLAILFWSVLLGITLKSSSDTTKKVLNDISDAFTKVVQFIIELAPFGIIGLVYTTISGEGLSKLMSYVEIIILLVAVMLFVMLIVFPLIVFILLKENPYPLVFYCIKNSAIPAFLTRSSAANIPINMEYAEKLGLNKQAYAVSIPLGSTVNMAGAAITIVIMTMATCFTLNKDVPVVMGIILAVLATVSAAGASGITGGSLLLIPLACGLFGISGAIASKVVGIGFIIGVIQDALETAINSSCDLLFTAVAEFRSRKKNGEQIIVKDIVKKAQ